MTSLAAKLRTEIERNQAIPFARFMELALYFPGEGYYERPAKLGRGGDFYTSATVGNLFGQLLAFQFAAWFRTDMQSQQAKFQIIEAGAHDGKLALDILLFLKERSPELFQKLEYCIIEPSNVRRNWQKQTLENFQNVKWFTELSQLAPDKSQASRIIISNELFDAMPVQRLGWNAKTKTWFEWGVSFDGENFIWKRLPEISCRSIVSPELAPELMEVLPDGFTTEICPAAIQWWKGAADILARGKIVAIDYGLLADEFFVPERSHGTLRAFFQHHASSDLLARPGEQDLTAHVNFSALQNSGETSGLKTEALATQSKFLTAIAEQMWKQSKRFGEWDASRTRQFQTLTHPEHLGRSFRVLIQSR